MHTIRFVPLQMVVALSGLFLLLGIVSLKFLWPLLLLLPLTALGLWDLKQPQHSLLRNYPIWGHLRYLIEALGPEIRQYLIENNRDLGEFGFSTKAEGTRRGRDINF